MPTMDETDLLRAGMMPPDPFADTVPMEELQAHRERVEARAEELGLSPAVREVLRGRFPDPERGWLPTPARDTAERRQARAVWVAEGRTREDRNARAVDADAGDVASDDERAAYRAAVELTGDGAEDPERDLDVYARTAADVYGPEDLDADSKRSLVSLARLPGWPGEVESPLRGWWGHGWGPALDQALGGGVLPGYMLAVGASSAGAGKTAWLMQVADGLALHCAEVVREKRPGPLTPVLILSEMPGNALAWRTLARWTGHPAAIFRAGKGWPNREGARPRDRELADEALRDAHVALAGPLADARQWQRIIRPPSESTNGPALLGFVRRMVDAWRGKIEREHQGREVWPVVVLDPIQRWQDPSKSEVEALNELVETLGDLARPTTGTGWIVLATSDTNKPAASGQNRDTGTKQEQAVAAMRGSYKLFHLVDAAVFLDATRKDGEPDRWGDGFREVDARIVKNRWGSFDSAWYRWETRGGVHRFQPALAPPPKPKKEATPAGEPQEVKLGSVADKLKNRKRA